MSGTRGTRRVDLRACLRLLCDWAVHAESYWYPMPDGPQLGCYGTGYNGWGVQTNQKYVSAMAVLSVFGSKVAAVPVLERNRARERALTALRFSLRSHVTGDYHCTDGTQWGHTWISALGVERMMHGVYLLDPDLTDEDRNALRRVLTSEAAWLAKHHDRGGHQGVVADPWAHTGKNAPESNLWNGAVLWRTAAMYPDHPDADYWRDAAHRFLMNAVSIPGDAEDDRVVAGRPVKDWHVGANFFPHYALDHHGYLNVGYMVICLSNAAMLHFDMTALGQPAPESLYHHLEDLWQVVRKLTFSDGRLARIGGDTRVRYAYCQEYLLPTLVFAVDQFDDAHAAYLLEQQLKWIEREAAFSEDGSFYGKRLAALVESSPYYYTRLESDRACALGMAYTYWQQLHDRRDTGAVRSAQAPAVETPRDAFEASVAGSWCDPGHGAVLHRCPTRFASFAWRAHGLAQGLCQPPDDGHRAEWSQNLGGHIRFLGDDGEFAGVRTDHRRLVGYHIDPFDGGFVTAGAVTEGVGVTLPEGWRADESALHQIAFAALPDEHTVIGLQHCRTAHHRTYVATVKGLHLNLPNDFYNRFTRKVVTSQGEMALKGIPTQERIEPLGSTWACLDDRVGIVGFYGAEQLMVHRSSQRRGGPFRSLYVDEVCFHCALGARSVDPNQVILDVGWAILSDVNPEQTQRFAQMQAPVPTSGYAHVRGVRVKALDRRNYVVLANFGPTKQDYPSMGILVSARSAQDLATGDRVDNTTPAVVLEPGHARVFVLDA